jgi:hypothetical protein
MTTSSIPFFVCHYSPEKARRSYIEREYVKQSEHPQFPLQFITQHDKEEPHVQSSYTYDDKLYRQMIEPIKNLQIGYWLALYFYPNAPYQEMVEWYKSQNTNLDQDFVRCPWLKEGPLSPGDVSLIWKHRECWVRIVNGHSDYAVVAEDDIIFAPHSLKYLLHLMEDAPGNFEYLDIAGGGDVAGVGGPTRTRRYIGFKPRDGNRCVNNNFYEVIPPKTRTTCAAILTKKFARRLIELNPPICLGIDWMLNWAFNQLNTKVYWAEPTVFGHGSQMQVYASLREAEHQG